MILFVGNFCFDFAMSQFFFEISLVQCVEFEYAVDWLCGHCFEDAQGTACPNFGSGLLRKVIDVFYRCPFWEQFEWMVSPKSCGWWARYIQRHPSPLLSHVVRRTVNDLWVGFSWQFGFCRCGEDAHITHMYVYIYTCRCDNLYVHMCTGSIRCFSIYLNFRSLVNQILDTFRACFGRSVSSHGGSCSRFC